MKLLLMIVVIAVVLLILIYLVAIKPGRRGKSGIERLMGVHYAHRGLHDNTGEAPENSLAAFRLAVEAGFGIEMDLQLSRDGQVVIFHDATMERACGVTGIISDYSYEELQQWTLFDSNELIPLFSDCLTMVAGQVPLIVEIKMAWQDAAVCAATDSILRDYQGLYCVESFNPLALIWFKNHHPEVVRGQLADRIADPDGRRRILYGVLSNLLFNWVTRPDFIAYNHLHAGVLARKICRGMYKNLAVAWTIKSEMELEQAKKHFDLFIFDSFVPKY
ncbi:MAG: glycerophosphodiester phosphodiesterase [Lachnospiraceae bacterium]|jgi:glycerophosphoryl diester phosphodiesterase|nr:glycerophosphodiester phosphodiesterase [Lachnospiraceae bacterium]